MQNRDRRLLIVVAVVPLLFFVLLIGIVTHHKGQTPTVTTTAKASTTHAKSQAIILSNVADFSTWTNTKNLSYIEEGIYSQVAHYISSPASVYTGIIRQGSFKTTHSDYNDGTKTISIPTVHYIVDIPDAKQSYVVTESGGVGYPYDILHITCPSAAELKYGDFGCVDEDQ